MDKKKYWDMKKKKAFTTAGRRNELEMRMFINRQKGMPEATEESSRQYRRLYIRRVKKTMNAKAAPTPREKNILPKAFDASFKPVETAKECIHGNVTGVHVTKGYRIEHARPYNKRHMIRDGLKNVSK